MVANAEAPRRADDAAGDFAAIRYRARVLNITSTSGKCRSAFLRAARCAPARGPARALAAYRADRSRRRPTAARWHSKDAPAFHTVRGSGRMNACSSASLSAACLALQLLAADGREHARRLLAAHHRGARIRPLEQQSRPIGAAAHRIVAGAIAATDDHGEFRHIARRPRPSPSWRRPWRCRPPPPCRPTMNPVMFCRNTSGMPLARAQLDEMRALQRAFREQDAVVRQDADRIAASCARTRIPACCRRAALNSSNSDSSTSRAITSRTSYGLRRLAGTTP